MDMPDIETGEYEEQSQLVQTETTGMHEMKVYNETRDKIHSYLSVLKQLDDVAQIRSTIIEIQTLLNTAHSLWTEINEAFVAKYAKLKATGSPVYSGELKVRANELNTYLKYLRYIDSRSLPLDLLNDKKFMGLKSMSRGEAIFTIQNEVSEVIESADINWGSSAVKAGINLPIRAKEEQSMFFRARKKASNPYKRW
jgi:hypothetical protein